VGSAPPASEHPAATPDDADAARLLELGYAQELDRRLSGLGNAVVGFATTSPVVGLYAVVLVGSIVAGPAWIWVLPVALAGQCLLLVVYAELAAEFPITGGAYQWTRRLMGPAYGWFAGWVAICAYAAANTTVAYLGAPWALTVLGIEPGAHRLVVTAMLLVVACALLSMGGVRVLKRVLGAGVAAEAIALVGIGLVLLLAFREQDLSLLTETLGAQALSGGSVGAALLAALAVGGWVFIGFDACIGSSEETRGAARQVPRAVWSVVLSVAAIVMLNAVATVLAHPDPAAVVRGEDADPVATAVVTAFGSWSSRPFAAVVLVAFVSCGIAAQGLTARTMYSIARDGVLPGAGFLRRVDARRTPVGGVVVTAVLGCAGLLLALDSAAIGSIIAFGTAAIYLSFLLTALAALVARVRGTWRPAAHVQIGRWGLPINALAVGWLSFETVNIAWPRASLAPPGAPFHQVWAAPLLLAAITATGLAYLAIASPHRAASRG
jgi:amino acid transporter